MAPRSACKHAHPAANLAEDGSPGYVIVMSRLWDVAILGATPAGCAAAYHLAVRGRQVIVFDAPRRATECPLYDWVGAQFFRDSALPRELARSCKARPFRSVWFHQARLTRQTQYISRGTLGHFLQPKDLIASLAGAAKKAGAKFRSSSTCPAVRLEEDQVRLLGSSQVLAKLLIIAQDCPEAVISDLALPGRAPTTRPLIAAGLDVPVSTGPPEVSNPRFTAAWRPPALHILEIGEPTELGVFFSAGATLHLRVISSSPAAGSRVAELSGMVTSLQRAGLLPQRLPLGRSRGAVWRPPAGLAIELETHVAKRCLLAGTAGGFAEIVLGQTLLPTVRSAILAAEAAMAALKDDRPQEALGDFKTSWRDSLGGWLRPLPTPLHMLLPMLPANRKLAAKLTAQLLRGDRS